MKINRRQILTASTTAALAPSALVELGKGERIDCQSHLFCPDIVALMENREADPRAFTKDGVRILKMGDWLRKMPPLYLDLDAKLATMDAAGIALTALSINDPGPEWFGEDAQLVARLANDFVAGLVKQHPGRFFGLCVLPFPDIKVVLGELDRCVRVLGMKGVLLYTNLAGRFSDEPEFADFWTHAEALGVPVLLHPAKPLTTEFVKGYEMTSTLGNMFDNTIALTRIIMSGLLERHPKLKLVCPHLGGTLPYIIGRLEHQVTVLKRGPRLARKPIEYLRDVWLDVVSPLPEAIRFCHGLLGPERLLFASDHPWVEPQVILDALAGAKLPAEDLEKIFSANASRLFSL